MKINEMQRKDIEQQLGEYLEMMEAGVNTSSIQSQHSEINYSCLQDSLQEEIHES